MSTLNCNGNLIDISTPKVMGILNVTPDSFYDGGVFSSEEKILQHTEKMLAEGATFIDVGAYSSRPNAKHISEKEELKRIVPIIKLLVTQFANILISVDTFRSTVAKQCVKEGACMVNDISAGSIDSNMFNIIADLQVPYCIMHMQGTPQNMQQNPKYENVLTDIMYYFSEKINALHALKVNDIIIDLGFGFGKTTTHNYTLLKNLAYFKTLEKPILTGISRKSMLYKPLKISAQQALNATTVANTLALTQGSSILRVHDVKEAMEAIKITQLL